MVNINVPNIGEDALEVTEILVKTGDIININQPIIIIEGDKSSMEIPSPYSGIIKKLYIKVGDKVHTGSVILSIKELNKDIHTASTNNKTSAIPYVKNESNLSENHNTEQSKNSTHNNIKHDTKFNINPDKNNYVIHATPVIRHMARKLGINLSKITGSGRKGRITKTDIEKYLSDISIQYKHSNTAITSEQTSSAITSDLETHYDKFGKIDIIPLHKIQKITGAHLQKTWSHIPHVTQFDIVDITNLEIFRKQQNLDIEKKHINCKITILVFIIKAAAKALKKYPRFNSSLSKDGHSLLLKKYINIGIAVDTKNGLIVPVLHNVNNKGIIQLSQELSDLAQKARSGKSLTPFELQGGSFTISNLGGIGGGIAFTPIINAPEVAILGVSKSSIRPIWINNKFEPRLMLPLSLSYDHRVIDGADGVRFMHLINTILFDIRLLSME